MAIFKRLTKAEINKDYDHYALMYGIIPIYVGDAEGQCRVCVRNWIPEWTLDFADSFFGFAILTMQVINPNYEPMFFLKLGKRIE